MARHPNMPDNVDYNDPEAPWMQDYEEDEEMRHPPEKLDRIIQAVRDHCSPGPAVKEIMKSCTPPGLRESPVSELAKLIRLGLPLMDAETANREVLRLTEENMRLKAIIEAQEMKEEGDD
jgi:hypothetical protein